MNDSMSAASCAASRSTRMSGDIMSVRSRSNAAPNSRASLTRMTPRLPESASGLSTAGYVVAAASGARIVQQRDSLKLRRRQTGEAERLACLQLVPAAVGGRRWIAWQTQRSVEVCGQERGSVADGKNRIGTLPRAGRNRRVNGLRLADEPDGNRVVGPGILELIAPVGRQHERGADRARRFPEGTDLIAGGRGEQKDALHTKLAMSGLPAVASAEAGSAQQYQASVRCGAASRLREARDGRRGTRATSRASASMASKTSSRDAPGSDPTIRITSRLKMVDFRITVTPWPRQRAGVESAHALANLVELQQRRISGDEQADAQLNRRDVFLEAQRRELIEQLNVPGCRRPRRERNEGRRQMHAGVPAERDGRDEIGTRMTLAQTLQHDRIDRFHRARHEEASGVAQQRNHLRVLQQMLDLDRHVVADPRTFPRESFDDTACVRRAVEEIRISKRDVLGAGRDLCPHVFEHHVDRDRAKRAAVHRHDRAMTAQVLAAAGGVRGADRARRPVGHLQRRIALQRQQRRAIGLNELQPRDCTL